MTARRTIVQFLCGLRGHGYRRTRLTAIHIEYYCDCCGKIISRVEVR